MTTRTQPSSAEDLLRQPEDGFRYELVKGEIIKMSPAGSEHGKLAMRIAASLFQCAEAASLGVVYAAETGFKIASDPDTVRAPDVAFVSRKRVEEAGRQEGYWPGAPDMAVEVISPGDVYTEVEEKVFDWIEAGTRMVIVVNPRKRAVTVYRSLTDIVVLTEDDSLDGADVVPGWKLNVKELFA